MKKPSTRYERTMPWVGGAVALLGVLAWLLAPRGEWLPFAGTAAPGVKVYTGIGEQKGHAFDVVSIEEQHLEPETGRTFRGVLVRFPSGDTEWKDLGALETTQPLYVRRDDPALR